VAGIFGVGATVLGGSRRPAIFVVDALQRLGNDVDSMAAVAASEPQDLPVLAVLHELGLEIPVGTLIVGFPMPRPQRAPGVPTVASGQDGTLGAPVVAPDGQPAFLTAGHAAPVVDAVVRDEAGEIIGYVLKADHLSNHGPQESCADFAIVDRLRGTSSAKDHEPVTSMETLKDEQKVHCRVRSGDRRGFVHSVLTSNFVLTEGGAGWGDVSLTSPISTGGDSGGPVMLDGKPGAMVGQIVGGHPSAISIVQDLDYLLTESGTRLRPWP
jgi:hypothetical protein